MITLDSVRLWIETRNGASFEDERMAVVGKSAEHFECPVVGQSAGRRCISSDSKPADQPITPLV
jgi:hypothetical protein